MKSVLHSGLDQPFAVSDVISTIPYTLNRCSRVYKLPPEMAFQVVNTPRPSDKFLLVIPTDNNSLQSTEDAQNLDCPLLVSVRHVYSKNVRRKVTRWLDEGNLPAGSERLSIQTNAEDYRVFVATPGNGQVAVCESGSIKHSDNLIKDVRNHFPSAVKEENNTSVIYYPNLIDNSKFAPGTVSKCRPSSKALDGVMNVEQHRKGVKRKSANALPKGLSVAAEVFFHDSEEGYPTVGEPCTLYASNQDTPRMLYKNIHYEIPEDCFDMMDNVYKVYIESLHLCSIVVQTKPKCGRPSRRTIKERPSYSGTSCDSGTSTLRLLSGYESSSKSIASKHLPGSEICSIEEGIFEDRSQLMAPLTVDLPPFPQLDQPNTVIGKQSILVDLERGMDRFFDETVVNDEDIDLSEEFFRQNLCLGEYRTSTPVNSCPGSPRSECSFTSVSDVPNKDVGSAKRSIGGKIRNSVDSCSSSSTISAPHRSQSYRISMSPIPFISPTPRRSKPRQTVARKSKPKPEQDSKGETFTEIASNAYFTIRTRSRRKPAAKANMHGLQP